MAGSVAGVREYPGTWAEFLAWFPDEAACARYLERPDGLRVGRRRGVHGLAATLLLRASKRPTGLVGLGE